MKSEREGDVGGRRGGRRERGGVVDRDGGREGERENVCLETGKDTNTHEHGLRTGLQCA